MRSGLSKVSLVLLACILSLAMGAEAAPLLVVDEPVWSLGIIVDKQGYEKTVTVANAGDEPLLIEKIEECCGFYVALEGGPRLLPGEKALLKLTVSTFKLVGDLRAEAILHSNDPDNPRYSIFALGQVVPKQHALGELAQSSLDLGVVDPRDRVPFTVRLRNAGNESLTIRKIERPATVAEAGTPPAIPPGEEREMAFEYAPDRPGPIEDRLTITTNDALNRTLTFQLKGYVSRQAVSDHALSIQPVGKVVDYDPQSRAFPYRFTVSNGGAQEVEILKLESSLPLAAKRFPDRVGPGQAVEGEVMVAPKPGQVPARGYVYFLLAVPVEVR
jgi:hypothetical protein